MKDGVKVGILHGQRFKLFCVICSNHSQSCRCENEIKTADDKIECDHFEWTGADPMFVCSSSLKILRELGFSD